MNIINVSAGIIIDGKKVLITRRAQTEQFAGGWEFPGGKVEDGETYEECLTRELKEELDIEVSVEEFCTSVLHDYGTFKVNLMAYYCRIVNGIISMSVHDKYAWAKIDNLLEFELLPADVPIANNIMEAYQCLK